MFRAKVAEKIETHNSYSVTFFSRKPCSLCDNVEKYTEPGRPQIATRRMRFAC